MISGANAKTGTSTILEVLKTLKFQTLNHIRKLVNNNEADKPVKSDIDHHCMCITSLVYSL